MKKLVCAATLLWVWAGAAYSQAPAETAAKWLYKPPPKAIEEAYPRDALRTGAGGRAVLECEANILGAVENCIVREDMPKGQGFGAATVSLVPLLLLAPATVNGAPQPSFFGFPVTYRVENPDGASIRLKHITGDVNWARTPGLDQIAAAFPKRATVDHGRVAFRCKFRADGSLRDCDKMVEEPSNMGFLAAARSLISLFQAGGEESYRTGLTDSQIYLAVELIKAPSDYNRLPKKLSGPALPLTPAALNAGVKYGSATIECLAGPFGAAQNCKLVDETTPDLGFGAAVIAAAAAMTLPLWTSEGLPLEGAIVRVRREFDEAPPK